MALNEMIAQGAQFKMPDPLEQYGRIAQIQQAQNQNALAQYQISSAQRADETNMNFLRELRAAGNDPIKIQQAYINAGKGKEASEYATSLLTQQKTRGDIQKLNRDDFTERIQDINNNSSKENVLAHMQDINANASYSPEFKALANRKLTELSLMSDEDRAKATKFSGMTGAQKATANRPLASGGTLFDLTGNVIGQAPEPGFTLSPGQVRYPRGYKGAVTAPAAAPAAVKSPDKITIMTALGYPLTPAGNEAYETAIRAKPTVAAASGEIGTMTSLGIPITPQGYAYFQELKTKPPVAAPQALTTEERNARAIALKAGPEGSDAFNAALRTEISRMTAKPVAAAARDDSSPDIKNMRALGIPETTAGFAYYNELKTKTPVAAAPAPTEAMKNANAFALLKGERGTPAFNKEFAAQMARLTAKSGGGEGGGTTVPKAPSGYRFNKAGDLEPIPGGPAAGKPLTDLQKQGLKKDFAADTSKIKAAVDTADEMEKLTDDLVGNTDKKIKPHPGLGGIRGYQGLLPSFAESPVTSGNAAKAEQKLETFKGKIKALGRSIASLDGKLGNMAVQEWQMVSDSVQAIKPTAGNLEEQMRDAVRQARLLAKNLRDKFDLTYEDTTPTAAPGRPAPAAAGGVVDFGSLR